MRLSATKNYAKGLFAGPQYAAVIDDEMVVCRTAFNNDRFLRDKKIDMLLSTSFKLETYKNEYR